MTLDSSTRKRRPGQTMKASERQKAQNIFIQAFAQTANVKASCLQAGVDRSLIYVWLEQDVDFSLKYRQAELDANDVIRAAILQRGIQGIDEPVVSAGKIVYTPDGQPLLVKKYSDNLLGLLARARLPEFKEKDKSSDDNQTTQKNLLDVELLAFLTAEELETVEIIIAAAQSRKAQALADREKMERMRA